MKLIKTGVKEYSQWVGQSFICPSTGNEYQIEAKDVVAAIGANNGKKIDRVSCPDCKAKIEFGQSQRDGFFLVHL